MASFVRRLTDRPQVAPDTRVIKQDEYLAAAEAAQVLADARARAKEMLEQAETTYEARKEEGYQAGLSQAQEELADQIMTIVGNSVDYMAKAEDDIARTVMACLRKILGEFDDAELVIRIARGALQRMRGEPRVTLRVRPDVEAEVQARIGEILAGAGDVGYLEIIGDEQMPKGGCRLESDAGVVDGGLERQLAVIERIFKERTVPPG
ncbi:MAG: HrpE/YscL family type III secretion apparatus protein [Pseudomonadota bacterium]